MTTPKGHQPQHSTDRYVEPKIRADRTTVAMKSQAGKGTRKTPRKHR